MCKILVVPHIPEAHRDKVPAFMAAIGPPLCEHDRDGIGFAMVSQTGKLYGARWADRKKFLDYSGPDLEGAQSAYNAAMNRYLVDAEAYRRMLAAAGPLAESVLEMPKVPVMPSVKRPADTFFAFGEPFESDEMPASLIMHARLATCEVGLHNNHPMWHPEREIAMIHNGVIRNHEEFPQELSTLDSEALLHAYIDANLNESLDNIQQLADRVRGYYACAAYQRDSDGRYVLDFWRDDTASMDAFYVHELQTVVFITKGDILKKALTELKWTTPIEFKSVSKEVAMRFNPLTGDVLEQTTFDKPSAYGSYSGGFRGGGEGWHCYSGKQGRKLAS